MKAFRISTAVVAFAAISLLAACGGGGGGGGTTPPAPTPTPAGSTTPSPTPAPTPTPTPTATGVPVSSSVVTAEENWGPNGNTWYNSGNAPWANTAGYDSASTATGPAGATFDTMTCANTAEGTSYPSTAYSQHMFLGIINNGTEEALPQALGMVGPVAPTAGSPSHPNDFYEVENYTCEYQVHTHDYSGLVHIEDINQPQNTSYTFAQPYATLQTLLDEWQATLNSSTGLTAGSNSLSGAVSIYVGKPSTTVSGADLVNSYTQAAVTPSSILLARHNAVWIVIGSLPTQGLPQVKFVIVN